MKSLLGQQTLAHFMASHTTKPTSQTSMQDYITQRLHGQAGTPSASAYRVISSLLTYPMTLSHAVNTLLPRKRTVNILMLGARAESTLPVNWWRESLSTSSAQQLTITMAGPGQQPSQKPKHTNWEGSTLAIHPGFQGLLHDSPDAIKLLRAADMFVAFHPGFGNPKMAGLWHPTLDLLFQTSKPVFCTAYSPTDLQQDMAALVATAEELDDQDLGHPLEFLMQPDENRFGSLKAAVDGEVTVANAFGYAFQAK